MFGIDCLGCGAQRAFFLVLQGEFSAALKLYPAIYTILVLLVYVVVNLFLKFRYDWSIKLILILINALIIIASYAFKMNEIFN